MTLLELSFRVFAVYYLASVVVDMSKTLPEKPKAPPTARPSQPWTPPPKLPFDRKPFNCVLCMAGWMSILLFFVPMPWIALPGVAGMAWMVDKLGKRLETFSL